ncbi:MAG: CinA family protein [bacterium]|nr:CinA family protein [bacterium]
MVRTISVFGLTESAIERHLTLFKQLFPQFKLEMTSKFPVTYLSLYTDKPNIAQLKNSVVEAIEWISRKLGNHVYSVSGQSMEQVVGRLLYENNATLAVAESCTGGLIANLLTDVAGSSVYFLFSAVTYSNQAKMNILKVQAQTLEKHGAVSDQIAAEMAHGARTSVDATYGLATSGIAGPGGGTDDKPVGTVCIGLATPSSVAGHRFYFPHENRRMSKHIFAVAALNLLRTELMGAKQPTSHPQS